MGTHFGPTLDNVPLYTDRLCSDGPSFRSYASQRVIMNRYMV